MSLLPKEDIKSLKPLDHDQLLGERFALLKEISSLEQQETRDDEITHLLGDLRQKYNHILDGFHRRSRKSRYDPMDRLPPELFGMIVYASLRYLSGRTDESFYDTNRALLLTLVSTRWRDVILGMPSIWNNIQVDSRVPESLAKTVLCLALSRDLPIQLNLSFPIETWDSFLPILLENRHRIQGISVYLPYPWFYLTSQIQRVVKTLEQLLPMPNLQRISTTYMDAPGDVILQWLLDHCSHLHAVTGLYFREDMLHLNSVRELRSVFTRVSLETFMSAQANMPRLTDVVLHPPSPHIKHSSVPILAPHPNSDPLGWRDLTCWYPCFETVSFLMPRLTNLKGLTLRLQLPLLKPFLTQFHRLPQLLYLSLNLEMASDKPDDTSVFIDTRTNDQVISLKLTCSYADQSKHSIEHISLSSKFIGESLARMLPSLQEATLSVPASVGISPFYEGRGLSKLSRLDLTFSVVDITLDHCYESAPSLRSIYLTCPSVGWPSFSSSHATQVRFGHKAPENPGANNAFSRLDSKKWPALRKLSIYSRCLGGQALRLPYLRELELQIKSREWAESWQNSESTTRLCKELATSATLLPSLERLSLWGFADWDILLLMIKRRNIVASHEVIPLKYLTVRACYPKELTLTIVSLLRGQFPDRWCLYDVSIHSTLELLCDSSM
jgi:hypothetical protein